MYCTECSAENARSEYGLAGYLGDVGPHDDLSYTGTAAPDRSQTLSDIVLVLSAISLLISFTK